MKKNDNVKPRRYQQIYQEIELISNTVSETQFLVKNQLNQYFISKKVDLKQISQQQKQSILKEISILKSLKNPNIIKIFQIFYDQQQLCYIQQYCEEGDLAHYVQTRFRKGALSQQIISSWFLQTLMALEYIHSLKIIHRNINPSNIYLTMKGNIKLGSFGFSKALKYQNYAQTVAGTLNYMSPQMIENKNYDSRTDIWSLGCMMYELCTSKPAFSCSNLFQLANKVLKSEPEQIPPHFDKTLNLIIKRCLKKKQSQRPTAKQLLKSPYFVNIMQKLIVKQGLILEKQQRIPIKKYKIHQKLEQISKKNIIKKKISENLPLIQIKSQTIQKKSSNISINKDDLSIKSTNTPIIIRSKIMSDNCNSLSACSRKSRQIIRNSIEKKQEISKQKKSSDKKLDKKSNQKRDRSLTKKEQQKKSLKIENRKMKLPQIPKFNQKRPKPPKSAVISKQIEINTSLKQSISFSQRKSSNEEKIETNWIQNQEIDYNLSITNKDIALQLTNFKKIKQENIVGSNPSQQRGVFESLPVRQDDETEIQKALKEEEIDINRLTMTINQIPQLLTEYKTKYEQLQKQLNYKYGPDLQTIEQKTNEFDSNEFARMKLQLESSKNQFL